MTSKQDFDNVTRKVRDRAFFRRKPTQQRRGDPGGLSIGRTALDSIRNITPHGIAHIETAFIISIRNAITNLALEVDLPEGAGHGNIVNVPYYHGEDNRDEKKEAERIADLLATASRLLLEDQFQDTLRAKSELARRFEQPSA
jgi:hypothetical protein